MCVYLFILLPRHLSKALSFSLQAHSALRKIQHIAAGNSPSFLPLHVHVCVCVCVCIRTCYNMDVNVTPGRSEEKKKKRTY